MKVCVYGLWQLGSARPWPERSMTAFPWRELPEQRADLETDIHTLRRIVPKERGMHWGDE